METGNFENGKARKKELADQRLINCNLCPYHRGENRTYHRPRPDKYKNKRSVPLKKIKTFEGLVADFNDFIERIDNER